MCKKIFLSILLFSNFFLFSGGDKELDLSSSEDKEKYDTIILTLEKEEETFLDHSSFEFKRKLIIAKIKGNDEEILTSIDKCFILKDSFEEPTFNYNAKLMLLSPNENLYNFDLNNFVKCISHKKEKAYKYLNKEGDTFFIQCEKTLLKEKRK